MHFTAIRRLFIVICALVSLLLAAPAMQAEEPAADKQQEAEGEAAAAAEQLDLIEIYTWTNSLPRDLVDLQADIDALADFDERDTQLPAIKKRIEDLTWEETSLKSDPNLSFHTINSFEAKIDRLRERIARVDNPIQNNIKTLESWHRKWLAKEKKLQQALDQFENEFESSDMFPEFYSLSDNIAAGKDLIRSNLKANLLAGHEIGKLQTRVYEMDSTAASLMAEANVLRTQQTSPSMLSTEFYQQISALQFTRAWDNLKLFIAFQYDQVRGNPALLAGALLAVAIMAFLVRLSRSRVKPSSLWADFADRPFVTSIFIFCIAFSLLTPLKTIIALPPDWDMIINLPLLASVGIFSANIFKSPWQVSLVRHLLAYFGLAIILTLINMPSVLFYLFVFYLSVGLILYYLVEFIRHKAIFGSRWKRLSVLIWFVFPVFIVIVGVSGFDQLAVVLFGRILAFIAVTLTVRLLLRFWCGFIELLLVNAPWNLIRTNAATIVSQLRPLLALLHFILWIAAILVIAWLYPTLDAAFIAMSSVSIDVMSVSVTPNSVLTVILTVYVTLLISRAIRAFLLQQVLPSHNVEIGAQISIARLIHYAVMTVGFIVLLKFLGFGMNQITILGGALGVGIGFGLQAIVNNFVSGLILLFERPIKVGDMIDVGDQVGEVKELGLRATTVQTFDNAEVVIPNSQLISANVTNWTLAEKKIRVKVPVGVAYGSDVTEVIRILLACAEANPIVLSSPKPVALFLAFGSSSLDFELRVWIADFKDKYTVLSELNQDIETEFDSAGIEIPFPQSDLHLRSIDEEAADTLHRARTKPKSTSKKSKAGAEEEKADAQDRSDR